MVSTHKAVQLDILLDSIPGSCLQTLQAQHEYLSQKCKISSFFLIYNVRCAVTKQDHAEGSWIQSPVRLYLSSWIFFRLSWALKYHRKNGIFA